MRYLVATNELFEGQRYSFTYDTKYKRFVNIHRLIPGRKNYTFEIVELASENFYRYFPGWAKELTSSNKLP